MSAPFSNSDWSDKTGQVTGTPTFFVGVTEEGQVLRVTRRLNGAVPFEQIAAAIEEAKKEAGVR